MFNDRTDAGKQLVRLLDIYKSQKNVIVCGLARGGVVLAFEIAKALHLPLMACIIRKVGAPYNPELAIGAIAADGQGVFNESIIHQLGISQSYISKASEDEKIKIQHRLTYYQKATPMHSVQDCITLLVDDGIATGASMLAAIGYMRRQQAAKIVVIAPVIASDTLPTLEGAADEIIYLYSPENFGAVSRFYRSFPQTKDDEVISLLTEHV